VTRATSARLAGITYLAYIAIALPANILFSRAAGGEGIAQKLAGIAQHVPDVRIAILLSLLAGFNALVLAVALYGITRHQDPELAVLALCCRAGEGVTIVVLTLPTVGLLWLATPAGVTAPDPAAAYPLTAFLFQVGDWGTLIAATLFTAGSTVFSWLLLRGRMIPVSLARLGVFASLLLLVGLPLRFAGLLAGSVVMFLWLPMLVFEVTVALWFIIKGVAHAEPDLSRSH
jgi:hypothetical protein